MWAELSRIKLSVSEDKHSGEGESERNSGRQQAVLEIPNRQAQQTESLRQPCLTLWNQPMEKVHIQTDLGKLGEKHWLISGGFWQPSGFIHWWAIYNLPRRDRCWREDSYRLDPCVPTLVGLTCHME